MAEFGLSGTARQTLAALQDIAGQMSAAQRRLVTGRRVNGPSDDPIAYFTSVALSGRAASLNGLMDDMSNAQSTIAASNSSITAVRSLLSSAQSLANQALQVTTSFVKVTGNNSTPLTTSSVIASNGGSSTRLRAGDQVTVSDGTITATYTAVSNDTVQTFLNAINNTADLQVTASLNSNGQIQLQADSNVNVTVGASLTGTGTLNGVTGLSTGTTNFTTNSTRQNLATQFDLLRTQVDQAIADASFNGVNLLDGDALKVVFNELATSSLTVGGTEVSAASLGFGASTNQFQTDTDVNAALTNLTSALAALESRASILGSNTTIMKARQDFTRAMIDSLNTSADELVASDVDKESVILLALQTRQQIASGLLALTESSQRSALRLFGS